jgi:hypothetical protein
MRLKKHPFSPLLHSVARNAVYSGACDELENEWSKVTEYKALFAQLELHGLAPLALTQLEQYSIAVPDEVRFTLTALQLRHSAITKTRLKVLKKISESFKAKEIPFIVLKGLALGQLIYPTATQRPMRDMDILLPKSQLPLAATALRALGFAIPSQYKSDFMHGVHQLPDATITFEDSQHEVQQTQWESLPLLALNHTLMLHHLCRHLQSQHPDDTIKLINIVDIVRYVDTFEKELDWPVLHKKYPHVISTLQCLDCLIPLPVGWKHNIPNRLNSCPEGVGECMPALSRILSTKHAAVDQLRALFQPPLWWLHLHYSVDLNNSLFWVKWVQHPVRLVSMFYLRLVSKYWYA